MHFFIDREYRRAGSLGFLVVCAGCRFFRILGHDTRLSLAYALPTMKHTHQSVCSAFGLMLMASSLCASLTSAAETDSHISQLAAVEQVILGQSDEDTSSLEPGQSWMLGWKGSVELGVNGASGNNDRFNIRGGVGAERDSDKYFDKLSMTYTYAKDESSTTQNRFEANLRHDWKLPDGSPWRVFVVGSYEYDDFQDWNQRISIGPGVGYQAIKNDRTDLLLRAGVVATKEIGGSENKWIPELDLGFDLEHKLTERQKLTVNYDFYPSLDKLTDYRMVGKVGWQIDVDPETNMFLKLGLEDRYDSTPGPDTKKNDLYYFATLGWGF